MERPRPSGRFESLDRKAHASRDRRAVVTTRRDSDGSPWRRRRRCRRCRLGRSLGGCGGRQGGNVWQPGHHATADNDFGEANDYGSCNYEGDNDINYDEGDNYNNDNYNYDNYSAAGNHYSAADDSAADDSAAVFKPGGGANADNIAADLIVRPYMAGEPHGSPFHESRPIKLLA